MATEQVRVLRVRSEESGSDKVAAALNKVAAGATAADKAVQKYIDDANASVRPVAEALAKSQDDFAKATLSTARSIQSLEQRIDPVARALSDYEKAQKRVNLAIDSGQISAEKGATILAGYESRYVKASQSASKFANDNEKAFALNRAGMMELRAAGINAFQALASGMSATQVAMMEGSQVIGAFVQGAEGGIGGALKGLGSSLLGVGSGILATFGTFPVVAIGATAAVAGLYKGFSVLDDWMTHTTADAKEFATWLDKIGQGANTTADFIDKVGKAIHGMSLVDLNKTARGSAEDIKKLQGQLTNPLAEAAGWEGNISNPAFVRTYQEIDAIIDKLKGDGYASLEDLHAALDKVVQERPGLQRQAETWEKIGEEILKAKEAGKQFQQQQERIAHGYGSYQPRDNAALQKYFSGDALADAKAQQAVALQSINARTVAQRAAAAAAEVAARPFDPNQNPNVRLFEEGAASAKVFAEATRQANDALRDTQDALKTAGLDGYARSLAEINVQLQRQIELNPENAATWEKVADAQKKALAINTVKSFYDPLQEQLGSLKAEASTIFASDDAHRKLLATLQAENDLRRQGIDLGSSFAQGYEHDVVAISNYAAAVGRIKDAWDQVKQGGGQAIDDLVNGLTDGTSKISDVLKNVTNDLLKTFTHLGVSNPLKNLIFGQHLPTLSDLFSPTPQAPSLSTPGLGSLGTVMNPMYVVPVAGAGGLGGGTGGLASLFTDPIGTVSKWLGLGGTAGGNPTIGAAATAIKGIESGGDYSVVNKVTGALGAYQVMPENVASWTKQALGYSMTPDQFLNSSSAQDSVFAKIFGGYMSKYGPSGAAQAWFGGPGSVGKNVSDALGTTSSAYVDKFNAALGSATDATGIAAKGLGALGSGFDRFGQSLANVFPAAPSSGGGGMFGWLGNLFGGSSPTFSSTADELAYWGFAAGTPAAPPGWAWVGEQGPELMRFRGGETVLPHPVSMGLVRGYANGTPDVAKGLKPPSGAGGNVNVNIQPPAGYEAHTNKTPDGKGGMNVNVMFRQIKGMLAKDIAEGGQTAKAIGGRFGIAMQPQGI